MLKTDIHVVVNMDARKIESTISMMMLFPAKRASKRINVVMFPNKLMTSGITKTKLKRALAKLDFLFVAILALFFQGMIKLIYVGNIRYISQPTQLSLLIL